MSLSSKRTAFPLKNQAALRYLVDYPSYRCLIKRHNAAAIPTIEFQRTILFKGFDWGRQETSTKPALPLCMPRFGPDHNATSGDRGGRHYFYQV
jgi:hypothetical protein